ncbi:1-deoxy-D-xylulose-5-phosphate reductoisomerase [Zhenpiania hominis]|uniref:1-deoxy-D-xylulose 5-phosphate reductoisomerase n=1 Tax=Zhenpiania hominis TaxID=2763644 RepID=A0A923NKF9_9FIRM|nr:1-deoxy-D-xylulose-5-phosphate reductoisomerase [Zhenpiania hominis]MBC6680748.1 1-deoxy-D-xylulose-5-phosphate reductoisomerase [Zhenpiania hominis]
MKTIAILGSTGSIGTQALDLVRRNPEKFSVSVLSCGRRIERLKEQIEEFHPRMVVVQREEDAATLAMEYPKLQVEYGDKGLIAAAESSCDLVLNSLVGIRGMIPTYYALRAGNDIAFANKETLVAGGELIMRTSEETGRKLLPVDSEHSAIFQCLQQNSGQAVRRILLTASGGPFRGYTLEQLRGVTLDQALRHPKWDMGNKITIDSATMMNKGLEIIEAKWLFDVDPDRIQVVVHPQSIVHSAVEYWDGSVLAQMGNPDMRIPISYAFSWPERLENDFKPLDLFAEGTLTFERPDPEVFKTLRLARQACSQGGTYPAALNGANEVLVQMFLEKKIGFTDIQDTIEKVLEVHKPENHLTLEGILEADRKAREAAVRLLSKN